MLGDVDLIQFLRVFGTPDESLQNATPSVGPVSGGCHFRPFSPLLNIMVGFELLLVVHESYIELLS